MAITDWPEEERPREKLLALGPASLSVPELLAIFLRVGVRGKSAVELGRDLYQHFAENLGALCNADQEEFTRIPGLGVAKFAQLQAALELARRVLREEMRVGDVMSSPRAVREYLQLRLGGRAYESFVVVLLDAQNRVVAIEELFRGTLTQTSVYPREVVRYVFRHEAAAVIFAHNHPSGLAEPSHADEMLTQSLKQALALIDVKVLDHFIVGAGETMSFAERGLL